MAAAWQEDLKALLAECRPTAPVGAAREAAAMAAACAEGREWELKLRYLPDHGPARVCRWLETATAEPTAAAALSRATRVDFTGTWWKDIPEGLALFRALPPNIAAIRLGFVEASEGKIVAAAVAALRERQPNGGGWIAVEPEDDEAAAAAAAAILALALPPSGQAPDVHLRLCQQPAAGLGSTRLPMEAGVYVGAPPTVCILPSELAKPGALAWDSMETAVISGNRLRGVGADAVARGVAAKLRKCPAHCVALHYASNAQPSTLPFVLSAALATPSITTLQLSYSPDDFAAASAALDTAVSHTVDAAASSRQGATAASTAADATLMGFACVELTAQDFEVLCPTLDQWLATPGLQALRLHAYRGEEAAMDTATERILERVRHAMAAGQATALQFVVFAWPGDAAIARPPFSATEAITEAAISGEAEALAAWEHIKRAATLSPHSRLPPPVFELTPDFDVVRTASGLQPPTLGTALPAGAARLRVVAITDTYTLDNYPHLKTLLEFLRQDKGTETICVHTGDFLMPYLLSSLDGGEGMMTMLKETVDFLTWGNHETDLDHEQVMARVAECRDSITIINSNMTTHGSMSPSNPHHKPFDTVRVVSQDGSHTRTVGLLGLLTNDPILYKPQSFGGAPIADPWEAIKLWLPTLLGDGALPSATSASEDAEAGNHNTPVDLVLPLCHLSEAQDVRTCQEFDFPVVLSGHDHHRVDTVIAGTRLLKAGSDAHYAVVLNITWADSSPDCRPTIEAEHVRVDEWPADPDLAEKMRTAYAPLEKFKGVEVCKFPQRFRPVSSLNPREGRRTFCTWFCGCIRDALNASGHAGCDAAFIKAANFCNGRAYGPNEHFTMDRLLSEMEDERSAILVVTLTGAVLSDAVRESWRTANPHLFQFDDGCTSEADGTLLTVGGNPLDKTRDYRIATCLNVKSPGFPLLRAYFDKRPGALPPDEAAVRPHGLLMQHFQKLQVGS